MTKTTVLNDVSSVTLQMSASHGTLVEIEEWALRRLQHETDKGIRVPVTGKWITTQDWIAYRTSNGIPI